MLPALLLLTVCAQEHVTVRADDTLIDRSCTVSTIIRPVADVQSDGVIQVVGDGITVDFRNARLRGAARGASPDENEGVGIWIRGRNVTLRNARVSGFRVGIRATEAHGLVLEGCEVRDNFRQRLRSTIRAEDPADWLQPHFNDEKEWITKYGAGIYIEDSRGVTVRACRVREGQNGLILDRVREAKIFDNDFSFLSGWGLALWRSSRNVITRNALDFCVRGYSHGVYNRGQDSAGLLMFEQCSDNTIAENSVTHGGDGLFAFAGREALGEAPPPEEDFDYLRRGNNDNLIIRNDFSYSAAHGVELTFSFGNRVLENRMFENAICGIWAGYSRDTFIAGNQFEVNGDMGYGLERGGINIEHGQRNWIQDNRFVDNACGVHLWWDPDEHLASLPWTAANGHESRSNVILANVFRRDLTAVQLRNTTQTLMAENRIDECRVDLDADAVSTTDPLQTDEDASTWRPPDYTAYGDTEPTSARQDLRGRNRILITDWGPYDWERGLLWPATLKGARHVYRLLGDPEVDRMEVTLGSRLQVEGEREPQLTVTPTQPGVTAYRIDVRATEGTLSVEGVLVDALWTVRVFPWETDPREDLETWRSEAQGATVFSTSTIDLTYGMGGPGDLANLPRSVADSGIPPDRFGTLAETRLRFSPGRWALRTISDDGIRLRADGAILIEDWTHHGPTEHRAVLDVPSERVILLQLEHFELDGNATLILDIEAE